MDKTFTGRRRFWLIAVIAVCVMLNPLNTTMISVAFSRIQEEFDIGYSEISLLISTYYIACAVGQPMMGMLSDIFGRKKVFISGLVLITISSMLAPFSPDIEWLMIFRVIQALGISTFASAGMGIIRVHVSENQTRALGTISMFMSTAAAFGPSIGGFLIHYRDWQAIFLINFPVIIFALSLSIKLIPKDGKAKGDISNVDIAGIIFSGITISFFVVFLMSLSEGGSLWKFIVSTVLTILFCLYESRKKLPFIDVLFLKNNLNVSSIYIQLIMSSIVGYSISFGLPSYLQSVGQLDAQQAGLIMLSSSGLALISTPLVARWIEYKGSRIPLITGSFIVLMGCLLLLTIRDESPIFQICMILAVFGASSGFHNLGLQTLLYTYIANEQTGIASGMFQSSRFIGTILCSSLLNIVFSTEISTKGLHLIGLTCVVISIGMILLSSRIPKEKRVLML